MKLKCTSNGNFLPLNVGSYYDVVELLEHPEHAMARESGGEWPKPGNPLYDIHPDEFFESPEKGLEIIHGGYEYIDDEFYGIIISNLDIIHNFLKEQEDDEKWDLFWDNPKTKYLFTRHITDIEFSVPKANELLIVGYDHKDLGIELSYEEAKQNIKELFNREDSEFHDLAIYKKSWRETGKYKWKNT